MPNTITGLLVLLVSLAPGLTYLLLAERRGLPARTHTVFRETAQVVLTSVCALTVTAALFGIVRTILPGHTPNVGNLLRHPSVYWTEHYLQGIFWSIGLLLFACLLAYMWGAHALGQRLSRSLNRSKIGRLLLPPADKKFVSAWWELFSDTDPESFPRVRCRLSDGSAIEGWLNTYNVEVDEIPDREFTLSGPIHITDPTGEVRTNQYGAACVSARSIVSLDVSYHDTPALAEDVDEEEVPKA